MIKPKKGAPKKKSAKKAAKKVAPRKKIARPSTKDNAAPHRAEKGLTIAGQSYLPPEGGWKIDKKVPIPPKKTGGSLWPFEKMNIGDSFFVPNVKDKDYQIATGSIRGRGNYNGVKLTFRQENGGLRVWVVAKKKKKGVS